MKESMLAMIAPCATKSAYGMGIIEELKRLPYINRSQFVQDFLDCLASRLYQIEMENKIVDDAIYSSALVDNKNLITELMSLVA